MVFDYFPYLQGRYFTYEQYFALLLFLYTLIPALCLLTTGYILGQCLCEQSERRAEEKRWKRGLRWGQEGCYWVGALGLTVAMDVGSMFDWLAVQTTIFLSLLTLSCYFLFWGCRVFPSLSPLSALRSAAHSHPYCFFPLLTLSISFSFLAPLLSSGLCICVYSPHIGPNLTAETNFSTRVMRMLTYERTCQGEEVCHVYLTGAEDMARFMFVNAQTSPSASSLLIHYGLSSSSLFLTIPMTRFPIEGLDYLGERHVHSVLLPHLRPATRYFFRLYQGSEPATGTYSFHTLPAPNTPLTTPLKLVIGGDSGSNQAAYRTAELVKRLQPDLVVIGGDVAYDNAIPTCYESWDKFLEMMEQVVRADGDLVPMVLGIGNHDVGLNSLSQRPLVPSASGPLFFSLFPQHFPQPTSVQVPPIAARLSYFHLLAGPCLFLLLDSGYVAPYSSPQSDWLNATLSQHAAIKYKFAVYHQPIYGSSQRPDYDVMPVVQGLKHWVPLFDEHALTVAFENHIHAMKRTKPLRGSRVEDKGTVYVGDGQWGTPGLPEELDAEDQLFEVKRKENHVWLVEISEFNATVSAYSSQSGTIIDHFSLPLYSL